MVLACGAFASLDLGSRIGSADNKALPIFLSVQAFFARGRFKNRRTIVPELRRAIYLVTPVVCTSTDIFGIFSPFARTTMADRHFGVPTTRVAETPRYPSLGVYHSVNICCTRGKRDSDNERPSEPFGF